MILLSEKLKVLYSELCPDSEWWMTKFLDKLVCEIFMCTLVTQTVGNLFCIESAWDKKKAQS